MKRVVVGVLVVGLLVGAAWTASSYWFGVETERRYRSILEQSSLLGQARFFSESYDRGIFGSRARTIVELDQVSPQGNTPDEKPATEPLRFTLVEDIFHGPLPLVGQVQGRQLPQPALAVIETTVGFDPEQSEALKQLGEIIPKDFVTRFTTVLRWTGEGETQISLKPFRQISGEEEKVDVDFGGLESQMKFSLDFKRFAGNLTCEKVRVATARAGLYEVGRVEGAFDQSRGSNGLFLGEADFKVQQLDIQGPQNGGKSEGPFQIKGFQLKTSGREAGSDLSTSVAMSMERLGLGEVGAEKALLEIELRKLEAKTVLEFQGALRELRNLRDSHKEMDGQALAKVVDLLVRLLRNSPEVEIKRFGFVAQEGELQAAARLVVDGRQVGDSLDLAGLVRAADLEASVVVSEELLLRMLKSVGPGSEVGTEEETEEEVAEGDVMEAEADAEIRGQLASLVAQGFLSLENGSYRTSARYAKGKLTVNQRDVPLGQILGQ